MGQVFGGDLLGAVRRPGWLTARTPTLLSVLA